MQSHLAALVESQRMESLGLALFFFALWAHRIDNFGALADITELRVRVRVRVRVRLRRWIINRKAQSIMLLWWGATVGNAWASCIL